MIPKPELTSPGNRITRPIPGGIEGKVVRVLDRSHIAINRGRNHGVEEGMVFALCDIHTDLEDPDTGRKMGEVVLEKIRMKIEFVHPEFSVGLVFTKKDLIAASMPITVRRGDLVLHDPRFPSPASITGRLNTNFGTPRARQGSVLGVKDSLLDRVRRMIFGDITK